MTFYPMFISKTNSLYRNEFSFRLWQDQQSALRGNAIEDENQFQYGPDGIVSPCNPCHLDCVEFSGIEMLVIND